LQTRGLHALIGEEFRATLHHFQDRHRNNLKVWRMLQSQKWRPQPPGRGRPAQGGTEFGFRRAGVPRFFERVNESWID
jgi:hypothetical protein